VIPNAISPDDYDPSYNVSPPVVTFVSNHIERKGIIEFAEAVETLLEDGSVPEFEVRIAGSGPLSDRAETLAHRYDSVTYLGYVSEAEKRHLLGTSSIFVLPTAAEGLPIAVLEGMAGGNAIVSTRVGSIPDVLTEDHGILIEVGDVEGLAETLAALLREPAVVRRMGRACRRLVETEYSWLAVREHLLSLYRDVGDDATNRDGGSAAPHDGST
jgi:glycosyltransferase involved in cell wall biosynthesis